jgi:hypothetical protein
MAPGQIGESQVQNHLLDHLGLDKDLVCEFLLCFSRFEYALKRSDFVKRGKKMQAEPMLAEPDWDSFADSLLGKFSSATEPKLLEAVNLLDSAPPQKQVLKDGNLDWVNNKKDASESQEKWILRLVRTVRNNLFHGGKYPGKDAPKPERDKKLLKACLTVLEYAMEFSPTVKQYFSNDQ